MGLVLSQEPKLVERLLLPIIIGYLFYITAQRNYSVGTDTINYVSFFDYLGSPYNKVNFFDLIGMFHARFEYGYVLLNKVVFYLTNDPRWLIITCAAMSYYMLFIFIKRVSLDPYLSLVMFVSLGYMASTMNTIRQGIAAAFIMIAYVMLLKKNNIIFCVLFVFFAFLFHKTAILFLVVIFIRKWKYSFKNSATILIFSMIFASIYGSFDSIINQINYTDYANSGIRSGHLGIVLNIFLLIFFLIVGFVSNRQIKVVPKFDSEYISFKNLDILPILIVMAIGVYIVSFNFSQLTRIASYFEIAILVYVPNSLKFIKDVKIKILLTTATYAVLLIYFFIILLLRPDWTNITPYSFG